MPALERRQSPGSSGNIIAGSVSTVGHAAALGITKAARGFRDHIVGYERGLITVAVIAYAFAIFNKQIRRRALRGWETNSPSICCWDGGNDRFRAQSYKWVSLGATSISFLASVLMGLIACLQHGRRRRMQRRAETSR